ncbi:MAG: SIS domain-containing protein [bacterium]|nr:SIS domain-containing protein [bacterium]
MHEEKIALVDSQIRAVQRAISERSIENVYFVACGGSLATLYPSKYIIERETAAVNTNTYTAAEFFNDPPMRLGEKSLVILNSQSGGTAETVAAAHLCAERGAMTAAFTTAPDSAIEKAVDFIMYYYDNPADPYPAVLTIFPEVYKLTYALLDVWNHTSRLPEVNEAMLRLQSTFDEACTAYLPAARTFASRYAHEPIIYTTAAGLNSCVGYVLTNCLLMESLWMHSSPLHAGEFFHGAFEAVDDTTAVFALLGLGNTRPLEERAVKFLQRKTKKLTVLDAAALDLSAYPEWLRANTAALVLNRLAAMYCDEMSYVLGHPISSRRYMGVEKY